MAADVALLEDVASGAPPALRLYRWERPALSLGRFQPDEDVDAEACRRLGVEVVRRPTGGRALLHGSDLTYALAVPRPHGASVDALYAHLARGLVAGLARLGVEAGVGTASGPGGPACVTTARGADLQVGGRKLCGSAQVHRGGAALQHGSVLLTRLPIDESDLLRGPVSRERVRAATVTLEELGAPHGPREVARALVEGFAEALDVSFTSSLAPAG